MLPKADSYGDEPVSEILQGCDVPAQVLDPDLCTMKDNIRQLLPVTPGAGIEETYVERCDFA